MKTQSLSNYILAAIMIMVVGLYPENSFAKKVTIGFKSAPVIEEAEFRVIPLLKSEKAFKLEILNACEDCASTIESTEDTILQVNNSRYRAEDYFEDFKSYSSEYIGLDDSGSFAKLIKLKVN